MKRGISLLMALLMMLSLVSSPVLATAGTAEPHTHKWVGDPVRDPTCTEPGLVYEYCEICYTSRERVVPAKGHHFPADKWTVVKEPTCTEPGQEVNYCTNVNNGEVCGYEWRRELPALGHDFGAWYVVKAPTPSEPGYEERICPRCKLTEQRPLYAEETRPSVFLNVYIPDEKPAYLEGEVIPYVCEVTNLSDVDLWLHWVYYYYPSGINGLIPSSFKQPIKAHETLTFTDFTHTVTGSDIEDFAPDYTMRFYVLALESEDTAVSYETRVSDNGDVLVTAHIGALEDEKGVALEKKLFNAPENGSYFTKGEIIEYEITVSNDSDAPAYNLDVYDKPDTPEYEAGVNVMHFDVLEAKASSSAHFTYLVTELDCERGYIENLAGAYWYYADSDEEQYTPAGIVHAPCGTDKTDVTVEKTEISTPANGNFYVEGEEVEYVIVVTNTGDGPAYKVDIYDMPQTPEYEIGVRLLYIERFDAGDSVTLSFTYTVTEDDCIKGYMDNIAGAYWFENEDGSDNAEGALIAHSDAVRVPCGEGKYNGKISITKIITSEPANGSYYVEGEEIDYVITVTNNDSEPLYNVVIHDSNVSDAFLNPPSGSVSELEGGEDIIIGYSYTVHKVDVLMGGVLNTAYVRCTDDVGEVHYAYTDNRAPTAELPKADVSLVKSVVSAPANGEYYTEGETIIYQITFANDSDVGINGVEVYDPLNGSNEDMMVDQVIYLEPHGSSTCAFSHTVTAEDLLYGSGYICNVATAIYYPNVEEDDADYYIIESNEVRVPVGGGVETDALLVKDVLSSPANGSYFVEGEEVEYVISFTLEGASNVTVYDQLINGNDPINTANGTAHLTYTITKEDAEAGYVTNQACAFYADDRGNVQEIRSNSVTIITGVDGDGDDEDYAPKVTLTKMAVSAPANGVCYTPGETVAYLVTITNSSDIPVSVDYMDDWLYVDNDIFKTVLVSDPISVAPHESLVQGYTHTVTVADTNSGYIYNDVAAWISWHIGNTDGEFTLMDSELVDTDLGNPPPVKTYPYVYKTVTSAPKNGMFYTLGEDIEYDVIIYNYTDRSFSNVRGYDILLTETGFYFGDMPVLPDGPSIMHVTYTVTETDVLLGSVYNVAWTTLHDDEYDEDITLYSNEVEVPTNGNGDYNPSAGAPSHCEYILTAEGDGAWTYINKYCAAHGATNESVRKLISKAETDEETEKALLLGEKIWLNALEREYSHLIATAEGELKEALNNDRAIFASYIEALRSRLILEGMSEKDAAEQIIETVRDRVCELCYTAAAAPEARTDVKGGASAEIKRPNVTECEVSFESESAYFAKDVYVCAKHYPLIKASRRMFNAANDNIDLTVAAWRQAKQYWQSELGGKFGSLGADAEGELKNVLLIEKAAFDACVRLRKELYKAFYPDDEVLILELETRMIREKAMSLCR